MNRDEYLLVCLAEECGEVQQVVGKCLRFGLDDFHSKTGNVPNVQLLANEIADIMAIVQLLQTHEILGAIDAESILKKKDKTIGYMQYSRKEGILE